MMLSYSICKAKIQFHSTSSNRMSDMGIDWLCPTDVESLEEHVNSLSPCLLSLKPDLVL